MNKMKMNDSYIALEKLNKEKQELLNSPYYNLGAGIKRYLGFLKHLKFNEIYKNLKLLNLNKKIAKKYSDVHEYKEVLIDETCIDKKIAIYTCITGDYDNVHIPLVTFDNVDYYLFTDDLNKYKKYNDIYKIVELPKEVIDLGPALANRYAKFHPFELLKGYDYSIYIDGNVRIVSDIRGFVYKSVCKSGIAMHRHSSRTCAYKEAEVCILKKKGNIDLIKKQMERYKIDGFPSLYGMNECSVIVSDLHNENGKQLFNAWWDEFKKFSSFRDQLSWPYVLWKNNYKIDDVGILGYNVNINYKLERISHN